MTHHAHQEARGASATRCDVQDALLSAKRATRQRATDCWRIEGGVDLDGDELTVVLAFEGLPIVVTVF